MKPRALLPLIALCACAMAAPAEAQALQQQNTHTMLQHTKPERALRDQDLFDQPANPQATTTDPNTAGPAAISSNRAIHRVYDPVSGLYCDLVGDCHSCPVSEKDEVYCRETGHRQELSCPQSSGGNAKEADLQNSPHEIRFKACTPTEKAHPVLRVITFEIVMAGILAGAYVLLQKERRKHLSSFDIRKSERQQRSTLLGAHSDKGDD